MDEDEYDIGAGAGPSSAPVVASPRRSLEASSAPAGIESGDGWGSADKAKTEADELASALEKDKLIKDIRQTQEGLKALLNRVGEVTAEVKKTSEENAMLQVYLDNMTKNTAKLQGKR